MSEELARKFHDTYERLAPDYGYETRDDTKEFDPTSPNGQLMIAVCGEVAGQLEAERDELIAALTQQRDEARDLLKKIADQGCSGCGCANDFSDEIDDLLKESRQE